MSEEEGDNKNIKKPTAQPESKKTAELVFWSVLGGIIFVPVVLMLASAAFEVGGGQEKIQKEKNEEMLIKALSLARELHIKQAVDAIPRKNIRSDNYEKYWAVLEMISGKAFYLSPDEAEDLTRLCIETSAKGKCKGIVKMIPDENFHRFIEGEYTSEVIKVDPRYKKVLAQERREEKQESRRRLIQQILSENPRLTGWQAEQILDARTRNLQTQMQYQERNKREQCKYGDTYVIPGSSIQGRCP